MKNAVIAAVAALVLLWVGWHAGYMHVIMNSEAYAIEDGDILMLEIDGQVYEYEVSPAFYKKLV